MASVSSTRLSDRELKKYVGDRVTRGTYSESRVSVSSVDNHRFGLDRTGRARKITLSQNAGDIVGNTINGFCSGLSGSHADDYRPIRIPEAQRDAHSVLGTGAETEQKAVVSAYKQGRNFEILIDNEGQVDVRVGDGSLLVNAAPYFGKVVSAVSSILPFAKSTSSQSSTQTAT